MYKEYQMLAASGPTWDQVPAFQWSTSPYSDLLHMGHPDRWDFPTVHVRWGTVWTRISTLVICTNTHKYIHTYIHTHTHTHTHTHSQTCIHMHTQTHSGFPVIVIIMSKSTKGSSVTLCREKKALKGQQGKTQANYCWLTFLINQWFEFIVDLVFCLILMVSCCFVFRE